MTTLLLPDHLTDRPFTIAEGRAAGMTSRELRSRALIRPFRGVRLSAGAELTLAARCAALQLLLPTAVFESVTAAALLGLPLPFNVDPGQPLTIRLARDERTRLPGVRYRSSDFSPPDPVQPGKVRVLEAADAWLSLTLDGRISDDDLVVIADAVGTTERRRRRLAVAPARTRSSRQRRVSALGIGSSGKGAEPVQNQG